MTQAPIHPVAHGPEPSPFARWLALLRPESRDLWVIFIFTVVVGLLALATPIAVEALVNTVSFGTLLQPVIVLALVLCACLGFVAALQAVQRYVAELIHRRIFVRVIAECALRIPQASYQQLNSRNTELVNRFLAIVTVDKIGVQLLLDATFLLAQTAISMIVLAFYHPYLLGFDIVLIATMSFIVFVLGRRSVTTALEESRIKYQLVACLESLAQNPLAFKLGGARRYAFATATELTAQYLHARQAHFAILMRQIVFSLGLQAVASTALLGLGGWLVINGGLTLGQLVASELLVSVIVGGFAKAGKHLEGFYDLMAAVEELDLLRDVPVEHGTGTAELPGNGPLAVRFHRLRLPAQAQTELQDLDIALPAGGGVLLAGRAGTGKSLLLEVLFGLHEPSGGYITFNGLDARAVDREALRRAVALVGSAQLFPASIAENIRVGRDLDDQAVRWALEQVGLTDVVSRLPDGIDTLLSDDSRLLSSAQQQALMVARAIVAQPRLILIDGGLDMLDADLLRASLAALFSTPSPWTIVVVSQRPEVWACCLAQLELPAATLTPLPAPRRRPPAQLAWEKSP